MIKICERNHCTGCNACVGKCPTKSIKIIHDVEYINPEINENTCVNCGLCIKICQNNYQFILNKPIKTYESWSIDKKRELSSSGGIARLLMEKFVLNGGYVCSCTFENGEFIYKITNELEKITKFLGSKYVKSNTKDIFIDIEKRLINNEKILFIGLPCHIAGLYMFLRKKYPNLYTVDLICHGTPSEKVLTQFFSEENIDINSLYSIDFRKKHNFQIICNNKSIEYKNVQDAYILAFLNGISYTENCYFCKYATDKRIGDITLGDCWSSSQSITEKSKGISFVMINTENGDSLFKKLDCYFNEKKLDEEMGINKQLSSPSKMPKNRAKFFYILNKKGLKKAVKKCLKAKHYKQQLKKVLLKTKLIKR